MELIKYCAVVAGLREYPGAIAAADTTSEPEIVICPVYGVEYVVGGVPLVV